MQHRLLASHALTKLGSKGWEFAVPLLLLRFSADGSLFAPTLFGLTTFVLKFVLGPAAGVWMDAAPRMRVVNVGIALQAAGVLGALGVLALLRAADPDPRAPSGAPPASGVLSVPLLVAMIGCGAVEAIGALISSVAVKKEWVPVLYDAADPALAATNTWMMNIDLLAETVGPLLAGAAMQLLVGSAGFALVGLANVVSFGLELLLLGGVYRASASLRAPKPPPPPKPRVPCSGLVSAWPAFVGHASGIPLLVVSYSLLYVTVLSPHGVVLTAYLQTRKLSPPTLALFRAAGALAGVAGMAVFRRLSERYGLRRVGLAHLWLLAAAVSLAATSFYAAQGTHGPSGPMLAFLGLVTVSRFGLYGFDLANLLLQQLHVDETKRASVGAVESSLCSLGTATVFFATLAATGGAAHASSRAAAAAAAGFDALVYASAGFVGAGALVYSAWYLLYHEHAHAHPLFEAHADVSHNAHGHKHNHAHGQAHSSTHGHGHTHGPTHFKHKHTTQQLRALEESEERVHAHLHFHPPFGHALAHLRKSLVS